MSVNQSSGVRLWIGNTDVTVDTIAEYAAQSWTEVNSIENLGDFGDESSAVNFTALKDARTQIFKGPRSAGTMAIVCGDDPGDPGQHIFTVAETTKFDYNIKVQLNDAITLAGQGSIHYFKGKVMSARRTVGGASDVVKRNFNLAVNSAILDVPAT